MRIVLTHSCTFYCVIPKEEREETEKKNETKNQLTEQPITLNVNLMASKVRFGENLSH